MESPALTARERRRLMRLARTVPKALLDVGTTEKVFASIQKVRDLLVDDKWACGEAGYSSESSFSSAGDVSGAPLYTRCGIRYDAMDTDPDFSADPQDVDATPAFDVYLDDLQYDYADSDPEDWAELLATASAPKGPLSEVYREITHLISLHREAGHVLFVCARRLGVQQGGGHNLGGQPDAEATWERWRDLRKSAFCHAHDALLRLKVTASAVTAAEDFIFRRHLEHPYQNGWLSSARQLVGDARCSLDEVDDSVRLMCDAVMREYFETWMILNRA